MASFSVPCPKCSSISGPASTPRYTHQHQKQSKISFRHGPNSRPTLISGSSRDDLAPFGFQWPNRKQVPVWKVHAQLNEVASEKSSNSAPVLEAKFGVTSSEGSTEKLPGHNTIPDAASISAFMSQVADLVKLVDSRDIMELQLKQLDCELVIRKKEALPQPPPAAPVVTMHHSLPHSIPPSQPSPAQAVAPAPTSPAPSAPALALPAPAKTSTSSHPPLKCPMAGTFYRSPAPGEPSFVKVGDKVQKGQVVCIIEAMKLMNEIEADQSGTIAEILAEDGKPVSVDTPLLVIAP
ncbi:hypothetical protein L1049_002134 [Liquidambar formosana]|uniref:Biotin carboxyl carrier protein of acetyl-CoA carboxylase n=1 Tax=Liquidambar formosana TaxID=63359 RepID=A0AAP0R976_LIQFO